METINLNRDNIGGLVELYAIPVADVMRIDNEDVRDRCFVVLRRNDRLIKIEGDEEFEFVEESTSSDDGNSYNVSIEGYIPAVTARRKRILEHLVSRRWLVAHKDGNGAFWLSGTLDVPMTFTYTRRSGRRASERNAAKFRFECIQPEASLCLRNSFA